MPVSTRRLAFLQGINVGGHRRVPMAELREVLAGLGLTEVATLLNSGNAVVTSDADPNELAARIEEALGLRFGFSVPVVTRSAAELEDILARNPFADVATDWSRYLVMLLSRQPDPASVERLAAPSIGDEQFVIEGREVYLWLPEGVAVTKLTHAFWQRRLGGVATGRNWKTLTALLALAAAPTR